jgi:hypothetical protein
MGQMNAMVELDECRDEISGGRYPPRVRTGKSNSGGGGGMDDVLRRLGVVEETVLEIRTQVSSISATLPHLATKDDLHAVKDDVSDLRTEVRAIAAILPHLATKDDVRVEISAVRVEVAEDRTQVAGIAAVIPHLATKADLAAVRVEVVELGEKLIKWLIATGIATAGLVVTAMKFVH